MQSYNRTSPWLTVEENVWDSLVNDKYLATYLAGAAIFWQSQKSQFVYIVQSGRVMMKVLNKEGKEKIMMFAEKGGIFGEISALENQSQLYSAIAIVDCQLYRIPISVFIDKLETDSHINRSVMKILCHKAKLHFNQVLGLTFGNIRYRVANIMLYLVNIYGVQIPEGIRIDLPFTHQDMADLIKSSRVSVSKIIKEFVDKGIIKKLDGRYVVYDLKQLERIEKEV